MARSTTLVSLTDDDAVIPRRLTLVDLGALMLAARSSTTVRSPINGSIVMYGALVLDVSLIASGSLW
jgi:hypothetical protein